ncbi:MAG TPA: hypothetical protein PK402_06580 [Tepidisphaeraceae bacterium]|nr:hypothetical protein [Tepidisphaeraceae bacterium]
MTNTLTPIEHPRTGKTFGDRQTLGLNSFARAIGVTPTTVWRWKLHGVKGIRLPTERIGSRIIVSRADFDRWHRAVNADDRGAA